jgi:hypothetical protein
MLEALYRCGIPEAVNSLHDLLCRTNLPAAADHDDTMQVFCQSELFGRQSPAVRQRIINGLEQHTQLADDSELLDVQTVLEDALPDSVREWQRFGSQRDGGDASAALRRQRFGSQCGGGGALARRAEAAANRLAAWRLRRIGLP